MEQILLPGTDLRTSRIALGMMRIFNKSTDEVETLIREALDLGINFFDHADIYGRGCCEQIFGDVLRRNPELREQMILQTKCDIMQSSMEEKRYDTSKEHIIASVNASLEKLNTDYIDILLLHRPDALCDPREVNEAFEYLYHSGKVRYFGVSNHGVGKIKLYQKYIKQPLIINQMQLSIVHSAMIDSDFYINMKDERAYDRDNGMIDFCMLNDITMQTWCPLQASWQEGTFIDNPNYPKLNAELARLADKYHTTKAAIAIAWVLRHPANMQVILGTTSPEHLRETVQADGIRLTRQEWYNLYSAEGGLVP